MKSGFCVLWGRPNVGKSTLLNALLKRKHVIVTPRPQTTRDRIVGVLHGKLPPAPEAEEGAAPEEYQIVFLDTPGIHEPQHKLGETLVRTARGALNDIECVLLVGDCSDKPHDDDVRAVELLKNVRVPVLLVLNKWDLLPENEALRLERATEFIALREFAGVMRVSALRGDGLAELKQEIIGRLPDGDPYFPADMMGDRPPEFHISERIREQALLQLREEVPHSVAVGVEQMQPRPNGSLYIEAFIYVERDSQKGIVIGKGGSRLKEIGSAARTEIEAMLGRSVFLEIRVKVRENWRESDLWIKRMGYQGD